jgi:hypothetical protein
MPSASSTGNRSVSNESPRGTTTLSKGKSPTISWAELAKEMREHIRNSPVLTFIRSRFTNIAGPNSVQEVHGNGSSSLETVTGDALLETLGSDEVVDTFVQNDGFGKVALKPGQGEEPLIPGTEKPLRVSTRVRKQTDLLNIRELGNVLSQTDAKTGSKKENDSLIDSTTSDASAISKTDVASAGPAPSSQQPTHDWLPRVSTSTTSQGQKDEQFQHLHQTPHDLHAPISNHDSTQPHNQTSIQKE